MFPQKKLSENKTRPDLWTTKRPNNGPGTCLFDEVNLLFRGLTRTIGVDTEQRKMPNNLAR